MVKSSVGIDVRVVVVAALVLLTVCLTVAFVQIARTIRKEHQARFRQIQQRLERDATALVDRLLRRD